MRGNKNLTSIQVNMNGIEKIYLAEGAETAYLDCRTNFIKSPNDIHGFVQKEGGGGIDFEPQYAKPTAKPTPRQSFRGFSWSVGNSYSAPSRSYAEIYNSMYGSSSSSNSKFSSYSSGYYVNHYTGEIYEKRSYTWRVNPYTGSGSYYDDSWDW